MAKQIQNLLNILRLTNSSYTQPIAIRREIINNHMGGCGPNHNEWVNDKTKLNQKQGNYQVEAELSQARLSTV